MTSSNSFKSHTANWTFEGWIETVFTSINEFQTRVRKHDLQIVVLQHGRNSDENERPRAQDTWDNLLVGCVYA
jgi:hypothetical protein